MKRRASYLTVTGVIFNKRTKWKTLGNPKPLGYLYLKTYRGGTRNYCALTEDTRLRYSTSNIKKNELQLHYGNDIKFLTKIRNATPKEIKIIKHMLTERQI